MLAFGSIAQDASVSRTAKLMQYGNRVTALPVYITFGCFADQTVLAIVGSTFDTGSTTALGQINQCPVTCNNHRAAIRQ